MEIKGILARDNTGWQDDFAADVSEKGYGVMWKDQFSDMNEIVPKLNHLIKDKGFFEYYNIANNIANFRMKIIDFATEDTYEVKKKDWKEKAPAWYCDTFDEYSSQNQKAKIAFLVKSVVKIESEKSISIEDFIIYNGKKASVKNTVAYTKILIVSNMNKKQIVDILTTNNNLILTGAPGTGKTYLTKQIAAQMILGKEYDEKTASEEEKEKMNEQYDFVQFHPSYDYTDFVEGLRPYEDEKGNIGFKREDGIFMKFCRKALDAYNKAENKEEAPKFVFVIDEINRGDISKIFGELFFSIDPGYRGEKGKVKTQYSNLWKTEKYGDSDSFYIPQNVYIIGTMNDIDRSVESMDFAMRRRFAFKEILAEDNMGMLKTNEKLLPHFDKIEKRMKNLNCAILTIQGLSTAYQIGAAYFLKLENYLASDGELRDGSWESLWDNHLNGLLFEYLRGLPDAEENLETLRSAYMLADLYKIENGKVIKEPSQNA